MHIVHYLQRIWLRDGGVVRAVLDLCSGTADAGHRVTLVCCDDQDVPEAWKRGEPGTPRALRIGPPGRLGGLLGSSIRRQIRPCIRQADVVHLHVLWDPVQLAFASVARELGIPYIQTPHGMLAAWPMAQKAAKKRIYYHAIGARLMRDAACVHFTAQGELDQSRRWLRHDRTRVVPLLFDLAPYRDLPGPEPARARFSLPQAEAPTVLFMGRVHAQKNPHLLIRAAAALRERGLDARFVIAGPAEPAYEQELRRLAAELGVQDRVGFLGLVSPDIRTSLYQACDLLCLPTCTESFGLVYFEAMAAGTPVLTTKGAATWRELEASGGGVTIDGIESPGAFDQLVDRLDELLRDRPRLETMGQAGRRWVLQNLAPPRTLSQYETMYADAAAKERGSGGSSPLPAAPESSLTTPERA